MKSTLDRLPVRPQGLVLQVGTAWRPPSGGRHARRQWQRTPARAQPPAAQRHRAGLLFSLPVAGARRDAAALPDRPDRLLQLHATGTASRRPWIGIAAYSRLFAEPGVRARCSRTTRCSCSRSRSRSCCRSASRSCSTSHVRGWRFFRSVFFLPTAVSWVVIGFVAARFFADEGILQSLLDDVGPRLPASRHALARALGARRGDDHVHLVDVRDEPDHLPRRHGDDRPGDLRRGQGRRRGPVRACCSGSRSRC